MSGSTGDVEESGDRGLEPVPLQLLAAGLGTLAGAAFGVALGWLAAVGLRSDCSPDDGWCDLIGALGGALVGVGVAAIAYIVAGVLTIVTRREQGRRVIPIVIHLAIPPTIAIVLTALNAAVEALP